MMNNSWPVIQTNLKNRLNPGIYQVWIKPLEGECDSRTLRLTAPNSFVASWVKDRLLDAIVKAAEEVLGFTPSISVHGATTKKQSSSPAPHTLSGSSTQPLQETHLGLPILPRKPVRTDFSWKFSFNDFVVGQSNEMAFMASHNFATQTFASDQLFLCSGPGLGKTHLIQAIGKAVAKASNRDHIRTIYLTAEEFANQMVHALKSRTIDHFKALYRDHTDILLLEDINFLQGKEKMQDELLATIKSLQSHGKKIVLTSSCLPKDLDRINPELSSRFCQGFISTITPPDFETRARIIRYKSKKYHVVIPDDVEELLAYKLSKDVRQLESCLHNLILKAQLLKENICQEMALQILQNYECSITGMDLQQIVSFICKAYDISAQELASRSRKKRNVLARNTAFFLARKYTDLSLEKIGKQFNRRHSTVLKGINFVKREISKKTHIGLQLEQTINKVAC
ncbi:chromosomal replication initiator protein DnaA [Desulfoplanes formicivorans]